MFRRAGASGDGEALAALAKHLLIFRTDLAREGLSAANAAVRAGSGEAAHLLAVFIAAGVGFKADWQVALNGSAAFSRTGLGAGATGIGAAGRANGRGRELEGAARQNRCGRLDRITCCTRIACEPTNPGRGWIRRAANLRLVDRTVSPAPETRDDLRPGERRHAFRSRTDEQRLSSDSSPQRPGVGFDPCTNGKRDRRAGAIFRNHHVFALSAGPDLRATS